MSPEVLCLAAAVARAQVYLGQPDVPGAELMPPHPAFVGFRRAVYVWREGASLEPVGEGVPAWLAFLRERGASDVRLHLAGDGAAAHVAGARGDDVWRATADEGRLTVVGEAALEHGAAAGAAPEMDMNAAAAGLAAALMAARAAEEDPVRRSDLERASAVLAAAGDGSDLSDVAWPYFLLPQPGYGDPARRLVAAAALAWTDASGDLATAVRAALCAALAGGRPVK